MATIAALERYMAPHLPGAARPFLQETIRRVLDDFLTRTEVWKLTAPQVDWKATGVCPLPAPLMTGAVPTRITRVTDAVSGCKVHFKTHSQLDEYDGLWVTRVGTTPKYFTMGDGGPSELLVYPTPAADVVGRLIVRAAFTTSAASTQFPDFVFSRYLPALVNGVVGQLLAIPGKDFTDLNLAASRLGMYEMAIPPAKSTGEAEFGTPSRVVEYGGL